MKWSPRLMGLAVFAVSVAMIAGSAMAQPGGRGPGGRGPGGGFRGGFGGPGGPGGGVLGVLRSEVVRKDVGIDDETAQKIRDIAQEAMQGDRPSFQGLRDLSEDERRAKLEEIRAQMQERMKDLEKKIAEVIGKEKFGRLKEIELQMAGVDAVARPDVAEFIGLTDEQKEKIRGLMEANRESAREKMGSVFSGNFRDMSEDERRAAFEKMGTIRDELRKELEKGVMGVLNADQKKKLAEMMGEPFTKIDEAREQMRAGFGGRGGPGGRGPGGGGDRGRRGDGGRRQRPA